MIAQVTAAALAAETKLLAHPACVDTIRRRRGARDHVSMGMTAALKARTAVENACSGLAIELLVAAQALDLGGRCGQELARRRRTRSSGSGWRTWRRTASLHRDIAAVREMLPEIEAAARTAAGL